MRYPSGVGDGEDHYLGNGDVFYNLAHNKFPLMECYYFGNGSYWFETDMQGNGDYTYPYNQLTKINYSKNKGK